MRTRIAVRLITMHSKLRRVSCRDHRGDAALVSFDDPGKGAGEWNSLLALQRTWPRCIPCIPTVRTGNAATTLHTAPRTKPCHLAIRQPHLPVTSESSTTVRTVQIGARLPSPGPVSQPSLPQSAGGPGSTYNIPCQSDQKPHGRSPSLARTSGLGSQSPVRSGASRLTRYAYHDIATGWLYSATAHVSSKPYEPERLECSSARAP